MATYKPYKKTDSGKEEVQIPASSVSGLAKVATSGSYNDLSNKPSIPANYTTSSRTPSQCTANGFYYVSSSVNSLTDVNGNPFLQYHTSNNDFRILATAYSDSWVQQIATDFRSTHIYYRIRNNGTWGAWTEVAKISNIPTVNNGKLTIQKNGTDVATFTANQSSSVTANITVPTKVSELTNDSGYTTNKGTVTRVKINGTTKLPNSAGLVDLGTISGGGGGGAQSSIPVEQILLSSGESYDILDISGVNVPSVAYGNFLGVSTVSQPSNAPTVILGGWDGSRWTNIKVIELKAASNADVSFEFMWDIGAGLFFIKTGAKGTMFSQSVINIPTNTTLINLEYQDNNTESSELRGVYYKGAVE